MNEDEARAGPGTSASTDVEPADEPPIEPGSPALENVLFVLLGALGTLAVVLRLVQLFG